MNYFLESVTMNKGLQVLQGAILNSLDIGTNLNVNGNLNGVAVSNYIASNTLTSTLLNYQSKLNNTTNKLPYDNISGTPDLVTPTFTGGIMNLVNGNKCQFA